MDEQTISLRSPWARPIDRQVVAASVPAFLLAWFFYPISIRLLGLAGPPVLSFLLIALAISAIRLLGRTELFISDIGLNVDHKLTGLLKIWSEHVPRRRARQAFVKTGVFQKKGKKNWSLHLLLDDGSTRLLLDGITDREEAARLEAKIEQLFSIENQPVAGEAGAAMPFSGDLLPYPRPLGEGDLLPTTGRFYIESWSDGFCIKENWSNATRLPELAAFAVLVVCALWLNGANWLFWLLTAWPIAQAAWRIKARFRFELSGGVLRLRNSPLPTDFQTSTVAGIYIAPAGQRGQQATDHQLVLVNRAGGRRSLARHFSLDEAYFLEKKLGELLGFKPCDPEQLLNPKTGGA